MKDYFAEFKNLKLKVVATDLEFKSSEASNPNGNRTNQIFSEIFNGADHVKK